MIRVTNESGAWDFDNIARSHPNQTFTDTCDTGTILFHSELFACAAYLRTQFFSTQRRRKPLQTTVSLRK